MKALSIAATSFLALWGHSALACTPIEGESTGRIQGDACSFNEPGFSAGPVERLKGNLIRQFARTGGGCDGEQIVIYFDCESQQGHWLGGSYSVMGGGFDAPEAKPPRPNADGTLPPIVLWSGPAEYFANVVEGKLGPAISLKTIRARSASQSWITQQGDLSQSRIDIDGHRLDLSCGCKLPQP